MKNNQNIKFAFFGTGDFALGVIKAMETNGYLPDLVITTPDKPQGRKMVLTPSPVKIWAQERNIAILQPKSLRKIEDEVHSVLQGYPVFIVADYGKIIPQEVIDIPEKGILNVHPSLLPKFRGATPIQSFILSGEEETGVVVTQVDADMDHGPILAQEKLSCPILVSEFSKINHAGLRDALSITGGNLLAKVLQDYLDDKIELKEQDHSKATFTEKIRKEDGLINWDKPTVEIYNQIRAVTPWPGAYFFINKNDKPFRIIITKAKLSGEKLIIEKIKPEGKNEMSFENFANGNKDIIGQITDLLK